MNICEYAFQVPESVAYATVEELPKLRDLIMSPFADKFDTFTPEQRLQLQALTDAERDFIIGKAPFEELIKTQATIRSWADAEQLQVLNWSILNYQSVYLL